MPHNKIILMTPGPTLVDYDILLAMAQPTINHGSPEFEELHKTVISKLKKVFETEGEVILIPGSGTSAMDLALRSVVRGKSKVLVLKAGYFADYLAKGARLLGADVVVEEAPLGMGFSPEALEDALKKHGDVDVIALQHVDTSTSVANPISDLAKVAREHGSRIIVDCVASAGGMRSNLDGWGIDVCFTGSQKALGTPPGLGIVAFSREFSRELEAQNKSLYFDLDMLRKEMESTKNYYVTPAVNLVYGLDRALDLILAEGLEKRFERHRFMASLVRSALMEMGVELVAKEGYRADTVTAAYLPRGVEWSSLYKEMRKRGIEIAGGLGELKGKIFRIGHMGQVGYNELISTIAALERSFNTLGYEVPLGKALTKMQNILASRSE
ncbi:MAG: alanine--glyoxylate aminotransferase family protein [Crenarchaeota archaeon]|nr:alanine--glyoxylate aminotransferase family protein [Thermoproteota archaeon]